MKRVSATLTSKGQITVPLEVRRQLQLTAGDRVMFLLDGEGIQFGRATSVIERTAGIASRYAAGASSPEPPDWFEDAVAQEVAAEGLE